MIESVEEDISTEGRRGNHATLGRLEGERKGLRSAYTMVSMQLAKAAA